MRVDGFTGSVRLRAVSAGYKLQVCRTLTSFLSKPSASLSGVVLGILVIAASNAWGLVVFVAKASRASGFMDGICWLRRPISSSGQRYE